MEQHIVGVFNSQERAEAAISQLMRVGISRDELSIVGHQGFSGDNDDNEELLTDDLNTEGAATGAAIGGITGLALGLAALAIPGIGPVVAAGPLALALGSAGTGALAGGLIGSLVDLGVPESEAHEYTEAVRRGGIVVTVNAHDGQVQLIRSVLQENGAYDLSTKAEEWRREGWRGYRADAPEYLSTLVERESLSASRSPSLTSRITTSDTETDADQRVQGDTIPVERENILSDQRRDPQGVRVYSPMKSNLIELEDKEDSSTRHPTADERHLRPSH